MSQTRNHSIGSAGTAGGQKTGRFLGWTTGLLALALIITGIWGYTQMRARRSVELRAENSYRRAFHELIFHSEGLEGRLDKLLVANSRPQLQKNLEEVRLQAMAAHEKLSYLPLMTTPLSQTKLYYGKLNDTAKTLSMKIQDNQPLSDTDWSTLKDLRDKAEFVARQINDMRDLQGAGRLNWTDLDKISEARYDGDGKHPLSNNLTKIDKFFASGGGEGAGKPEPAPKVQMRVMAEPEVSQDQALEIARRYYAGQADPGQVTFQTGVDGDWPSYRFQAKFPDGRDSRIDITKNGGHISWVMSDREVKGQAIAEAQAVGLAEDYLRKHGYPEMAFSSFEEYDGRDIGLVSLVYQQDGVLIYPDVIRVRVALDNGEILGHTAISYLKFHHRRSLPSPKLSRDEAVRKVSPRLQITSVRPAVMRSDEEQEILTYEVRGKVGEEEYQIFINALNGGEERILKIQRKT